MGEIRQFIREEMHGAARYEVNAIRKSSSVLTVGININLIK